MVIDLSPNHLWFGSTCIGISNSETRPASLEWPFIDEFSVTISQVPQANENHKVVIFSLEGSDRKTQTQLHVLRCGSLIQGLRRRSAVLRKNQNQEGTDEDSRSSRFRTS